MKSLQQQLCELFPNEIIRRDFFHEIRNDPLDKNKSYIIDLEDNKYHISPEERLDVVSIVLEVNKAVRYSLFVVVVAVGGVLIEKNGIVYPKYFFARFCYNEHRELFSVDFMKNQFSS